MLKRREEKEGKRRKSSWLRWALMHGIYLLRDVLQFVLDRMCLIRCHRCWSSIEVRRSTPNNESASRTAKRKGISLLINSIDTWSSRISLSLAPSFHLIVTIVIRHSLQRCSSDLAVCLWGWMCCMLTCLHTLSAQARRQTREEEKKARRACMRTEKSIQCEREEKNGREDDDDGGEEDCWTNFASTNTPQK